MLHESMNGQSIPLYPKRSVQILRLEPKNVAQPDATMAVRPDG